MCLFQSVIWDLQCFINVQCENNSVYVIYIRLLQKNTVSKDKKV